MEFSNTPSGIDWRYTAMKVRLGPFDAFVVVPPLVLFLMHIKLWTFCVALIVIITMGILEIFFRFPLPVAIRTARRMAAGPLRPAMPWWKHRRL